MHILQDEKANNIIVLEFQGLRSSKGKVYTRAQGKFVKLASTHPFFQAWKVRWSKLRDTSRTNKEDNVYPFFFCSFQILCKCTLSQQVYQKAIEHSLEHIVQATFLLEGCQGFFLLL
jgi:hypothetical protein